MWDRSSVAGRLLVPFQVELSTLVDKRVLGWVRVISVGDRPDFAGFQWSRWLIVPEGILRSQMAELVVMAGESMYLGWWELSRRSWLAFFQAWFVNATLRDSLKKGRQTRRDIAGDRVDQWLIERAAPFRIEHAETDGLVPPSDPDG